MKKTILALSIALSVFTIGNAQQIEMDKIFGGYKYSQNGNAMTMKDLVKTMASNQEAYQLIKKAQSNNTLASIIGFAGGGLIGFPIGTAIGGGDANWVLAGVGAGLVAISIPISSGVNKKAKEAVALYNASLNSTSYQEFKPKFKIIANGTGVGLCMNF